MGRDGPHPNGSATFTCLPHIDGFMRRRGWVLVLAVLLTATAAAGCLRDFEDGERSRLRIEDVDVAAPTVTTGKVTLDVAPTLVNRGGETGTINVTVKAYDDQTGLLVDTATTSLGTVPEEVTREPTLTVETPREHGVRLRVEIHEDDQLVQTGQVTVSNLGGLQPTVHDTPLGVGQMDFLVRDVSGGNGSAQDVRIETSVYLTNEGEEASDPVRMQAKAREAETSLLGDETWVSVPTVAPGATHVASVNLTVPDQHNYIVQVALWDGDFILERGRGTVQLLPQEIQQEGEEIVVSDPDVRDFVREDEDRRRESGADRDVSDGADGSEAAGAPGPGVGLAAAALAAGAAAATRLGGREP